MKNIVFSFQFSVFKIQFSVFSLLLYCAALNAQYRHEFSLYGGGGLSTLKYDVVTGTQKNGLGGHFGVGYHYFFSPKWGLGTGLEGALYHARFELNNYQTRYQAIDMESNPFEFRSTLNDHKEKQSAMLLQIPLMLQYQTGKKHQFYAAAGGKVGFPLSGKYKISGSNVQNSGYYAEEDYEYTTQEFMGFGAFSNVKSSGDLSFKTAFFASADLGVKWKLNDKGWSLYTGIYVDYGLNNIADAKNSRHLVAYNTTNPRDFAVNSVIHSHTQNSAQSFTDKIIPIAAGIKLRLAFGKGSAAKKDGTDNSDALVSEKPAGEDPSAALAAAEEQARKDKEEADRLAKAAEEQRLADEKARQDEARRLADEKAQQDEARRRADDMQEIMRPVGGYALSETPLNNVQKSDWDKIIALLQRHPEMKVFIYGHTCNTGGTEINEKIGLQRAENVKAYLLSKGIAQDRILGTASKRDTEPLVPNNSEENRKKNRRVELVVH